MSYDMRSEFVPGVRLMDVNTKTVPSPVAIDNQEGAMELCIQ